MRSTVATVALVCGLLTACTQGVPMQASGWTPTAQATQPVSAVFAECLAEAQTAKVVLVPAKAADPAGEGISQGIEQRITQQDVVNSCMRVRGFVPAQTARAMSR
jgi:hypothetical protein